MGVRSKKGRSPEQRPQITQQGVEDLGLDTDSLPAAAVEAATALANDQSGVDRARAAGGEDAAEAAALIASEAAEKAREEEADLAARVANTEIGGNDELPIPPDPTEAPALEERTPTDGIKGKSPEVKKRPEKKKKEKVRVGENGDRVFIGDREIVVDRDGELRIDDLPDSFIDLSSIKCRKVVLNGILKPERIKFPKLVRNISLGRGMYGCLSFQEPLPELNIIHCGQLITMVNISNCPNIFNVTGKGIAELYINEAQKTIFSDSERLSIPTSCRYYIFNDKEEYQATGLVQDLLVESAPEPPSVDNRHFNPDGTPWVDPDDIPKEPDDVFSDPSTFDPWGAQPVLLDEGAQTAPESPPAAPEPVLPAHPPVDPDDEPWGDSETLKEPPPAAPEPPPAAPDNIVKVEANKVTINNDVFEVGKDASIIIDTSRISTESLDLTVLECEEVIILGEISAIKIKFPKSVKKITLDDRIIGEAYLRDLSELTSFTGGGVQKISIDSKNIELKLISGKNIRKISVKDESGLALLGDLYRRGAVRVAEDCGHRYLKKLGSDDAYALTDEPLSSLATPPAEPEPPPTAPEPPPLPDWNPSPAPDSGSDPFFASSWSDPPEPDPALLAPKPESVPQVPDPQPPLPAPEPAPAPFPELLLPPGQDMAAFVASLDFNDLKNKILGKLNWLQKAALVTKVNDLITLKDELNTQLNASTQSKATFFETRRNLKRSDCDAAFLKNYQAELELVQELRAQLDSLPDKIANDSDDVFNNILPNLKSKALRLAGEYQRHVALLHAPAPQPPVPAAQTSTEGGAKTSTIAERVKEAQARFRANEFAMASSAPAPQPPAAPEPPPAAPEVPRVYSDRIEIGNRVIRPTTFDSNRIILSGLPNVRIDLSALECTDFMIGGGVDNIDISNIIFPQNVQSISCHDGVVGRLSLNDKVYDHLTYISGTDINSLDITLCSRVNYIGCPKATSISLTQRQKDYFKDMNYVEMDVNARYVIQSRTGSIEGNVKDIVDPNPITSIPPLPPAPAPQPPLTWNPPVLAPPPSVSEPEYVGSKKRLHEAMLRREDPDAYGNDAEFALHADAEQWLQEADVQAALNNVVEMVLRNELTVKDNDLEQKIENFAHKFNIHPDVVKAQIIQPLILERQKLIAAEARKAGAIPHEVKLTLGLLAASMGISFVMPAAAPIAGLSYLGVRTALRISKVVKIIRAEKGYEGDEHFKETKLQEAARNLAFVAKERGMQQLELQGILDHYFESGDPQSLQNYKDRIFEHLYDIHERQNAGETPENLKRMVNADLALIELNIESEQRKKEQEKSRLNSIIERMPKAAVAFLQGKIAKGLDVFQNRKAWEGSLAHSGFFTLASVTCRVGSETMQDWMGPAMAAIGGRYVGKAAAHLLLDRSPLGSRTREIEPTALTNLDFNIKDHLITFQRAIAQAADENWAKDNPAAAARLRRALEEPKERFLKFQAEQDLHGVEELNILTKENLKKRLGAKFWQNVASTFIQAGAAYGGYALGIRLHDVLEAWQADKPTTSDNAASALDQPTEPTVTDQNATKEIGSSDSSDPAYRNAIDVSKKYMHEKWVDAKNWTGLFNFEQHEGPPPEETPIGQAPSRELYMPLKPTPPPGHPDHPTTASHNTSPVNNTSRIVEPTLKPDTRSVETPPPPAPEITTATVPVVESAPEVSNDQLQLAVVHKGEGVTHALMRQLMHRDGLSKHDAILKAKEIAIKSGYIHADGTETRVSIFADRPNEEAMAYQLNGNNTVQEIHAVAQDTDGDGHIDHYNVKAGDNFRPSGKIESGDEYHEKRPEKLDYSPQTISSVASADILSPAISPDTPILTSTLADLTDIPTSMPTSDGATGVGADIRTGPMDPIETSLPDETTAITSSTIAAEAVRNAADLHDKAQVAFDMHNYNGRVLEDMPVNLENLGSDTEKYNVLRYAHLLNAIGEHHEEMKIDKQGFKELVDNLKEGLTSRPDLDLHTILKGLIADTTLTWEPGHDNSIPDSLSDDVFNKFVEKIILRK